MRLPWHSLSVIRLAKPAWTKIIAFEQENIFYIRIYIGPECVVVGLFGLLDILSGCILCSRV